MHHSNGREQVPDNKKTQLSSARVKGKEIKAEVKEVNDVKEVADSKRSLKPFMIIGLASLLGILGFLSKDKILAKQSNPEYEYSRIGKFVKGYACIEIINEAGVKKAGVANRELILETEITYDMCVYNNDQIILHKGTEKTVFVPYH